MKLLKGKYGAQLEFPEGWGIQTKTPSMGGLWVFSGTTHLHRDLIARGEGPLKTALTVNHWYYIYWVTFSGNYAVVNWALMFQASICKNSNLVLKLSNSCTLVEFQLTQNFFERGRELSLVWLKKAFYVS